MKERKVLAEAEAYEFYREATKDDVFTYPDNTYQSIGGWWEEIDEKGKPVWIAYDFTSGNEVFIEDFLDKQEAIKYASGIIATTKSGQEI